MKRALLTLAVATALTAPVISGGEAFAQHRDRRHDGVPNRYDRHDNRRYDRHARHHWRRGERLDRRFHSSGYVVRDYRRHGWRPPPRGYAYYRTDSGDVVLAAIATGVISAVIANALIN
jgi:Ni/Co efflux regulator RcnB